MPTEHIVEQGDCLASIAEQYGLDSDTIWNDAANATLKEKRGVAHVLLPGDVVVVPDLRVKSVPCAAGAKYRFRRKDVPARFRLRLLDADENPRAGVPYSFRVAGKKHDGVTDEGGWIIEWIPPKERHAELAIGDPVEEEFDVQLGELDPPDTRTGAVARLASLGYLLADSESDVDDAVYLLALGALQYEYLDEVTLALDDPTVALLRELYGS
jgi:hypothetical protein